MRIDTVEIRSMIARAAAAAAALAGATGVASAGTGAPSPWQMDLQGMVTETGRGVADFHYCLLWIITAICFSCSCSSSPS